MWIPRYLEKRINEIVSSRPSLLLTGIRQSGKSALLKRMFPQAVYITLDKIMTASSAEKRIRMLFWNNSKQKIVLYWMKFNMLHLFSGN